MENQFERLTESIEFIRTFTDFQPKVGLVLGTGLGSLVDDLELHMKWDYSLIPHFPVSTVEGHAGSLLLGYLQGVPVVVLNGRFHYYEGYSAAALTYPIRLLAKLGIERLMLSNVVGSVNSSFKQGDIVVVKDHIFMQPDHPLRGPNDDRLGLRFPDMINAYDLPMRKTARRILASIGLPVHQGVYYCLQGPSLETPAEYKMINNLGADVVGMSTVPEVIVARHMGLPVFVSSLVSNECFDFKKLKPATIEEVIDVAKVKGKVMASLWKSMLSSFKAVSEEE